jgi:hypothetical protein
MNDDDVLGPDMHRLPWFPEVAPPVADQDSLERLLDGRLDPGSAPPGYGGVARLLEAAAAPAAPEELAGEQEALAQFAAVHSRPPTRASRRTAVPSKLFTMKAAAAALVAVLSIGGVAAAATGLLPGRTHHVADRAPAATVASTAGHGVGAAVADLDAATQGLCRAWQAGGGTDHGRRTDSEAFQALAAAAGGADNVAAYCKDVTTGGSGTSGQGRASAVGPDATASARVGLCRAWQADKGADQGQRVNSVAFQALAAAAGGADKVGAYCADVTVGSAGANGQGQGQPPSSSRPGGSPPSTTPTPPSSGPPPGAGPGGHGQGGPPTTTG